MDNLAIKCSQNRCANAYNENIAFRLPTVSPLYLPAFSSGMCSIHIFIFKCSLLALVGFSSHHKDAGSHTLGNPLLCPRHINRKLEKCSIQAIAWSSYGVLTCKQWLHPLQQNTGPMLKKQKSTLIYSNRKNMSREKGKKGYFPKPRVGIFFPAKGHLNIFSIIHRPYKIISLKTDLL